MHSAEPPEWRALRKNVARFDGVSVIAGPVCLPATLTTVKMSPMHWRCAYGSGLVAIAVAAALIPLPALFVERWFSAGLYPRLQSAITPFTNAVPFAWFDVILVVSIGGALTLFVKAARRSLRQRNWRPLFEWSWVVAVATAAGYLVFLAVWGLNYRRLPMEQRIVFKAAAPLPGDLRQLGMDAIARVNSLHARAHVIGWSSEEWRNAGLVEAFRAAQASLVDAPPIAPGRLKATILGPYFRWTGIDGMVDPFALEVLANPDLLPWERPFVAAHEWAHLAGFADESEASFVAWLAMLRGDEAAQYSGWLYVYWQVSGDLGPADRQLLAEALETGPRRDVSAIVERLRRGQLPALRTASWAVYDQYLRANRVEEGIRSYGEVVTLILRARFADGFRPVRRGVPAL